jgi:hypothetical protein
LYKWIVEWKGIRDYRVSIEDLTEMEITTLSFSNGKNLKVIKTSFTKGKNYFLSTGYELCPNKNYLKKDNSIVHYNNTMKCWIID